VQFLNLVTGAHSNAGMFWSKVLPDAMVLRFGSVVLHAAPDVNSPEYGHTIDVKEGECEDIEKETAGVGGGGHRDSGRERDRDRDRDKKAQYPLINLWHLLHQSDGSLLFALLPQLCAMTGIGLSSECKKQLFDFEAQMKCTSQDRKASSCCYDNSDTTHNVTNITDDYRFHSSGSRTYHSMSSSTHHPRQQAHFEFVMADITEILPVKLNLFHT
jgi:hypothetical protein